MTTFVKFTCRLTFAIALAAAAHATPSLADVLEIGGNGVVTVYRAPAVYTSEGVRPIVAPQVELRQSISADVAGAFRQSALKHSLDAGVLEAVAWRESGFRPNAVSSKGAVGLMQIMPSTALALGVDRYDTLQNIEGGARYLHQMLGRYGGNLSLALAAYNAGPGAVDRYGGIPPFRETQSYVDAIIRRLATRSVSLSVTSPALIEP